MLTLFYSALVVIAAVMVYNLKNFTRSDKEDLRKLIKEIDYLKKDLKEKDNLIEEKDNLIEEKDNLIKEKDILLGDADYNKLQAKRAFDAAEQWRSAKVKLIYSNVTDDELDHASRWISYAQPFSEARSCKEANISWITNDDLKKIWDDSQLVRSESFHWNETCRRAYLTLHAFHTTGIEGNTLTLSETSLIIDSKPLITGFSDEDMYPPATQKNLIEVRNIQHILDALKLSSPPTNNDNRRFNLQILTDINSAITRDTGSPFGLRRHSVAVGHQYVVLPMPDEVGHLTDLYTQWLNDSLDDFLKQVDEMEVSDFLTTALGLACDAHTRFVHIHPFPDGNGRLPRILSGLVLKSIQLPMPMFTKSDRINYIGAVATATIDGNYSPLCSLHAQAAMRSLSVMTRLSQNGCTLE